MGDGSLSEMRIIKLGMYMKQYVKKIIKAALPPILVDAVRSMYPEAFYGLSGSFSSWEEAEHHLQKKSRAGYAEGNILSQVLSAIQEVRAGRAVFERDGVLEGLLDIVLEHGRHVCIDIARRDDIGMYVA